MTAGLRFPRGLYGVTPEWDDTARLVDAIRAAALGGMVALQWRRKTGSVDARLQQAHILADLCKQLGLTFIVNDDWRLATLIDADGVHVGRDDGLLSQARLSLGADKIIGCSCYNEPRLAQQALMADVDYVAFGAVYPSSIKPNAARATLEHIKEGRRLAEEAGISPRTSVIAIGGITPANAAPLIQAGADGIAMISGLFECSDIQAEAKRCAELFA